MLTHSCTCVSDSQSGWVCVASVLLCVGNLVLLACWLWIVALFFARGVDPDLMTDGQLCPPQPSYGPRYPCDPLPRSVVAVGEVQVVRQLLVPALLWCVLSLAVWLLGRHAARSKNQQAAVRPE